MAQTINRIRNASFKYGKTSPRTWTWKTGSSGVTWTSASGREQRGVTIEAKGKNASGTFSQTISCKADGWLRIEATVACALDAADETSGLVLTVQPMAGTRARGEAVRTVPVHRSTQPVDVCAILETPDDIKKLRVSVGIENATGWARIEEVRVIDIIEPDAESHALAIPPPPHIYEAPRRVKKIAVMTSDADRPLAYLLGNAFGANQVSAFDPDKGIEEAKRADALLIPDENPPRGVNSLSALMKLAAERIVVISLPAFNALKGVGHKIKRIEQEDDPINGKIAWAFYATQGFALEDVFPYAWPGEQHGSFMQNQFTLTSAFKAFCKKHAFDVFLESMCDQDVTSDRPVGLFKLFDKGALFVLDLHPVEAPCSTLGEANLAFHLLLSVLGKQPTSLGQYIVPHETEAEFRASLREMAVRFTKIEVHDEDVPADELHEQLVTIGREDESFGLPLKPKPAVIVRSGLQPGDMESVYGSLTWFKQLVRMVPHRCPYADALASRFRLAWVPWAAEWEDNPGWQRSRETTMNMGLDLEDGQVAALIDVVSRPGEQVQVVLPERDAFFAHCRAWLPQLAELFMATEGWMLTPPNDRHPYDRDAYTWRPAAWDVEVVVDAEAFESDLHVEARRGGASVVQLAVPGNAADFNACSILRTHVVATALEHVIGLHFGLMAVNRSHSAVTLDGFKPLAPGEALVISREDAMLQRGSVQVG